LKHFWVSAENQKVNDDFLPYANIGNVLSFIKGKQLIPFNYMIIVKNCQNRERRNLSRYA